MEQQSARLRWFSWFFLFFFLIVSVFGSWFVYSARVPYFLFNLPIQSLWFPFLVLFFGTGIFVFFLSLNQKKSSILLLHQATLNKFTEDIRVLQSELMDEKTKRRDSEGEIGLMIGLMKEKQAGLTKEMNQLENWMSDFSEKGNFSVKGSLLQEKEIEKFFLSLDEPAILVCYALLRTAEAKITAYEGMIRFYLRPISFLRQQDFDFVLIHWFDKVIRVLKSMNLIEIKKEVAFHPFWRGLLLERVQPDFFKDGHLKEVFQTMQNVNYSSVE